MNKEDWKFAEPIVLVMFILAIMGLDFGLSARFFGDIGVIITGSILAIASFIWFLIGTKKLETYQKTGGNEKWKI